MRWTHEQLREKGFARDGSRIFHGDKADSAVAKYDAAKALQADHVDQGPVSARYVVIYTIFTRWPYDGDNIVTKFYTDALVDLGILPGDTAECLETRCRQIKVEREAQERTQIEVFTAK